MNGLGRYLHYGWIIAVTGVLVLLSSIGLGRWAYTVLLPSMRAALHLSYRQMSVLGASNYVGYLAAVLFSALIVQRYRERIAISAGLLLLGGCMVGMSCTHEFAWLVVFFSLAGAGSGLATIPMLSLIIPWFYSDQRGKAAGLVLCGNGIGITLAGVVVPRFNQAYGTQGWQTGWLCMSIVCLAAAFIAGSFLRNHPSKLGVTPFGRTPVPARSGPRSNTSTGRRGVLVRLGLLYLAFGLTSTVYGTFIVTSMIHEYGVSERNAGLYWSWAGVCSLFSGVGFGWLSDRIGRKYGLAIVFGIHTLAYALAGWKLGTAGVVASVTLFGLSVFGTAAVLTAAIGDNIKDSYSEDSDSDMARVMAISHLLFAAGQSMGPVIAVGIAGISGIFTSAFLFAALASMTAALFALTLPSVPKRAQLARITLKSSAM